MEKNLFYYWKDCGGELLEGLALSHGVEYLLAQHGLVTGAGHHTVARLILVILVGLNAGLRRPGHAIGQHSYLTGYNSEIVYGSVTGSTGKDFLGHICVIVSDV